MFAALSRVFTEAPEVKTSARVLIFFFVVDYNVDARSRLCWLVTPAALCTKRPQELDGNPDVVTSACNVACDTS